MTSLIDSIQLTSILVLYSSIAFACVLLLVFLVNKMLENVFSFHFILTVCFGISLTFYYPFVTGKWLKWGKIRTFLCILVNFLFISASMYFFNEIGIKYQQLPWFGWLFLSVMYAVILMSFANCDSYLGKSIAIQGCVFPSKKLFQGVVLYFRTKGKFTNWLLPILVFPIFKEVILFFTIAGTMRLIKQDPENHSYFGFFAIWHIYLSVYLRFMFTGFRSYSDLTLILIFQSGLELFTRYFRVRIYSKLGKISLHKKRNTIAPTKSGNILFRKSKCTITPGDTTVAPRSGESKKMPTKKDDSTNKIHFLFSVIISETISEYVAIFATFTLIYRELVIQPNYKLRLNSGLEYFLALDMEALSNRDVNAHLLFLFSGTLLQLCFEFFIDVISFQLENRKTGQHALNIWRKRESSYMFVLVFAIIFSLTSVNFDRVNSLPGEFEVVPYEYTSPENTTYAAFCFENNSINEKVGCHCRKQWSEGYQSSCPCDLSRATTGSDIQDKWCMKNYPHSNGLSVKRDVGCDKMSFIDEKLISPCLPPGDKEIMIQITTFFYYEFNCETKTFTSTRVLGNVFRERFARNKTNKTFSVNAPFTSFIFDGNRYRSLVLNKEFLFIEDDSENFGVFLNKNIIPIPIGKSASVQQQLCVGTKYLQNYTGACPNVDFTPPTLCMDGFFGIHVARGSLN